MFRVIKLLALTGAVGWAAPKLARKWSTHRAINGKSAHKIGSDISYDKGYASNVTSAGAKSSTQDSWSSPQ